MRKGSWPYKVDQLLQQYEAEFKDKHYRPTIRQLKKDKINLAIQVERPLLENTLVTSPWFDGHYRVVNKDQDHVTLQPQKNDTTYIDDIQRDPIQVPKDQVEVKDHILFIGNGSNKRIKADDLSELHKWAKYNGLESSVIFYRTDKPKTEQVYRRLRDEYSNFRTGPLSHYPSHVQQRMFSLGDRELAGKRFHPLQNAIVKGVRVPQFAYNLQDDDLSTIVMQQAVRNYDHLRGTDRWAYAQNDHNRPLDRVYLDTKRVNVTIADIVDRAAHNQLINGRQTTLF